MNEQKTEIHAWHLYVNNIAQILKDMYIYIS